MKKLTKTYLIIISLIFTLMSCKNGGSEKVELVYENGIEKISVEIENGQKFLLYDKPTKTDFILTNIDPFSLRIQGLGIKVLGTRDATIMRTEINVPSNYLDKDTLTIKVRYGEGNIKECEFKIPLKKLKQTSK